MRLALPGRFHELSLATPDIRASVEFYERLGFSHAATGDTFSHPYGVLTDGRLHLGLHQRAVALAVPTLTFVRPGIAACVGEFTALGIELTVCRTGEEEFNEIGFEDPFGHGIRIIEARTYSPAARTAGEASLCGEFAEITMPAADFAAAREFWEPLGFVAAARARKPYGHLPLTSDHVDIAFHRPDTRASAMIVFRAPDMPERLTRLRSLGVPEAPLPRGLDRERSALLEAPEGTALLLRTE
ncbi:MAG TPA: VOC family protein [Steroidobacteraceae bacterium]|nr:VOC family protein [Steroidobacteraceae bacterium]